MGRIITSMKDLFETDNILGRPFEALLFDIEQQVFPVQAHWHYYTEMLYILEGTAIVTCNGIEYTLSKGSFILFFPQVIHSIYRKSNEHLSFYVLKFDINRLNFQTNYIPKFKNILKGASSNKELPIVFHSSDFSTVNIQTIFLHCVNEAKNNQYGYDAKIQCELSILLLEIIRKWLELDFQPSYMDSISDNEYSIHDILIYIEENIQTPLRISELAQMCHMSYSYFAKSFRTLYGQSCKEYIEYVRLSKAENLLLFTNADLTYISNETGFSDCSHFIRIFKRKYGITPKQYRMDKNPQIIQSIS